MNKTARKLAITYSLAFSAIFILAGLYLSWQLERKTLLKLKESLTTQTRLFSRMIHPEWIRQAQREEIQSAVLESSLEAGIKSRITVMDAEGAVLGDSERSIDELAGMDNHKHRPEVAQALRGEAATQIRFSRTVRRDMLYAAVPVKEGGPFGRRHPQRLAAG